MGPNICVFCSANDGLDPQILAEVEPFVKGLKERQGQLLYGGGRAGLMGAFADCALSMGVPVRGAITERLNREHEVGHTGIDELVVVPDLFLRKQWFLRESDAFFVFPGGFGTLDEAMEVLTWKGLGELDKPIVYVNINGFWNTTLASYRDLSERNVIRDGAFESFGIAANSIEAWHWFDKV